MFLEAKATLAEGNLKEITVSYPSDNVKHDNFYYKNMVILV
jgi:hypothetical protein